MKNFMACAFVVVLVLVAAVGAGAGAVAFIRMAPYGSVAHRLWEPRLVYVVDVTRPQNNYVKYGYFEMTYAVDGIVMAVSFPSEERMMKFVEYLETQGRLVGPASGVRAGAK